MSSQGPAAAYADPIDSPGRRRTWLLPTVLLVFMIVILAAVVVLAQRANDSGAPPRPADFVPPASTFPTVPYDIQQRSENGSLTIAATKGETFDVNLDNLAVEVLDPIEIGEIDIGDRVSVIGRSNDVRNFVITSIVDLGEGPDIPEGDAGYRSATGFQGWEASRDQTLRPVIAGIVTSTGESSIVLDTSAGEVSVELVDTEGAGLPPIYRLSASADFVIDSGDRLALAGMEGDDPGTATAAIVQPASAEPPAEPVATEAPTGG